MLDFSIFSRILAELYYKPSRASKREKQQASGIQRYRI